MPFHHQGLTEVECNIYSPFICQNNFIGWIKYKVLSKHERLGEKILENEFLLFLFSIRVKYWWWIFRVCRHRHTHTLTRTRTQGTTPLPLYIYKHFIPFTKFLCLNKFSLLFIFLEKKITLFCYILLLLLFFKETIID